MRSMGQTSVPSVCAAGAFRALRVKRSAWAGLPATPPGGILHALPRLWRREGFRHPPVAG